MDGVLTSLLTAQPAPAAPVLVGTLAVAALLVAWSPSWRLLRHVVTIAHEGGHALVATLAGRQLQGIRLHSDTSGLTVSSGRPRGVGVVATLLAGYPAPALVGLLGAWALDRGLVRLTLVGALLLLVALLVQVRNVFGVLTVLGTGGVLLGVTGYAPAAVQSTVAYLLVAFLLLAAPRPLVELHRSRRGRRGAGSDADQLAGLTRVPAVLWTGLMAAVSLAAAVLGFGLLLR